jgi:hypothetical protein
MLWVEYVLLLSFLNKANWTILTQRRRDTLLLLALFSSSERYTGVVEGLELPLKRRSNRCLV